MKLTPLAKAFIALVILGAVGYLGWHFYGKPGGDDKPKAAAVPDGGGAIAKAPPAPRAQNRIVVGVNDFGGAYPGLVANDGAVAGPNSRFKAAGLDVEFKIIRGSKERLAAFDAGEVDVMLLTLDYFANLVPVYRAKNVEIRSFLMADWSRGNMGLVTKPAITSVEGLKDAKIATTRNTPTHYFILSLLRNSNLSPADAERVKSNLVFATKTPLAGEMFQRGEVDAVAIWEPHLSQAMKDGKGRLLVSTATASNLVADVLFAREGFVKAHEAELAAFARAWFEGVAELQKSPDAHLDMLAKAFEVKPDEARGVLGKIKPATFADNRVFFGLEREKAPYLTLFDEASRFWQREGVIKEVASAPETRYLKALEAIAKDHASEVVVDQMRSAELQRLATHFDGGFKRLLSTGAVLDGHYGHQNTYTGPGHALVLSGSYGYLNGIIQNKWYNRAAGRSEGMLFDAEAKPLVGEADPGEDNSPRNFIGSTVGDELKLATGGASKTVAVAVKERGALLLGGRLGQAYWFSEAAGEMTTSTYYSQKLPDWVVKFNAQKIPDQAFGKNWERALPVGAYAVSGVDDNPWEGDQLGLKRTFPHPVTGGLQKPGPKFYEAFTWTPFAIDYEFAMAREAINAEQLGGRGVTDLLAISVSPTDLIGHNFGVYSHEAEDAYVRTDRALGQFLTFLDGKLGKDGYVVVLTADHGAAMPPEQAQKLGLGGKRVKKAEIKSAINNAIEAKYGKGDWVVALEDPSVYLNQKLIAEKKIDKADVELVAGEALMGLGGFAGYFTRTQIERGWLPPTAAARAVARSFHPARSGDVVAVQAPFSYWGKYGEKDWGGSHGSFYRYDSDVPLIFAGPPFKAGNWGQTEMVDVAATLARMLGTTAPAACEGEPITRALK